MPDGTEGNGTVNTVVDRPFVNNFQGGTGFFFKIANLKADEKLSVAISAWQSRVDKDMIRMDRLRKVLNFSWRS
jgi:hypothetical protein